MAAPTDPTATTIVTEAFNKVGNANPSATELTRAETYWLVETYMDIWSRVDGYGNPIKYEILQEDEVQVTTVGISRYSFASDYDEEISISFLDGDHTGTAQAGANTTITLEDGEDAGESDVVGNYILTTGGTGSGQLRQVTTYSTTTYVATIAAAWSTNPSSDTTYRIINRVTDLEKESLLDLGTIGTSFEIGNPSSYAVYRETDSDYFMLDKPPSASTFGLYVRYYVNIHHVDITGDLMTKIYRNWRPALVYGVAAAAALNDDDDKYEYLVNRYEALVAGLIAKELPYGGEFEGFTL